MKTFANLFCQLILLTPAIVFSQKTFISPGAELALPSTFGLKKNAGTGFGGFVRLESSWGKHIAGMVTIEYISFAKAIPYSGTPSTTTKVTALPIQLGLKYYATKRKLSPQGFYISAELGLMPTTTRFTYANNAKNNFKESGISCAPGIGYQWGNIQSGFSLQYNLTASGFNVYYFNFRLAYSIKV